MTTTIDKERHAKRVAHIKHGTQAKPGFDLNHVALGDGDRTIRNLRLKAIHCGWMEYEAQNGEVFRVEDGLL